MAIKKEDLLLVNRVVTNLDGSIASEETHKTTGEHLGDMVNQLDNNLYFDTTKILDLTKPINDDDNFGATYDADVDHPIGRLFQNVGEGTAEATWIYIGGNKRDAVFEVISSGTNGRIESVNFDETTGLTAGNYTDLPVTGGNNGVVNATVDGSGYLTDLELVASGDGYGDSGNINIGGTTVTINLTTVDGIDISLTDGGNSFEDPSGDNPFDTFSTSGDGMKIEITTTNDGPTGTVTVGTIKIVGGEYPVGSIITVESNTSTEKYGREVAGTELITWTGEADPGEQNNGWIVFTNLASPDKPDSGFVLKTGDKMSGQLTIDTGSTDASIVAENNVIVHAAVVGDSLSTQGNITGNALYIDETAEIHKSVTLGYGEDFDSAQLFSYGPAKFNSKAGYDAIGVDPMEMRITHPIDGTTQDVPLDNEDFVHKAYVDGAIANAKIDAGGVVPDDLFQYEIGCGDNDTDSHNADIILTEYDTGKTNPTGGDTLVTLVAGENIILHTNNAEKTIEIEAEAAKVYIQAGAPDLEPGNLWYNTLDGRLYVCYEDAGDGSLPASIQWVDASPSAINGGDYVYKYGDTMENFLTVDGNFTAKHYQLDMLDNIPPITP